MENLKVKIRHLLTGITTNPKMFFVQPDFAALHFFMEGYFLAVEDATGISLNRNFSTWLVHEHGVKFGYAYSVAWPYYILGAMEKCDEKLAYNTALEELQKFIDAPNAFENQYFAEIRGI